MKQHGKKSEKSVRAEGSQRETEIVREREREGHEMDMVVNVKGEKDKSSSHILGNVWRMKFLRLRTYTTHAHQCQRKSWIGNGSWFLDILVYPGDPGEAKIGWLLASRAACQMLAPVWAFRFWRFPAVTRLI